MTRLIHLTAFLFLWSSIAAAQTSPRDTLINRVESAFLQISTLSADSPLIDMYLDAPKSANPGVSNDTWLAIKKEVAAGLVKVMTQKGGTLDRLLRQSLELMSDAELDKLSQMLSDPIFIKFQGAMASPSAQEALMKGMFGDVMAITAGINYVLVQHGLKEVH